MTSGSKTFFGKEFEPFIGASDIDAALARVAASLNHDFAGHEVIMLGVLDGAFMVMSDLVKKLDLKLYVDFIKFKSYHGQQSTGSVRELLGVSQPLGGKHIVVVEDIVDTGNTLSHLLELLASYQPASVSVAALLIKEEIFQGKFPVKYKGISIANRFVVGYGMDYDGLGRELPEIYAIKE